MPINEIHARLGDSALLLMVILGLWGLYRWWRNQTIDQSYFGALVVGELLMVAQMVVGIYQWLVLARGCDLDRPGMHYLYGFLTVLSLPAVYSFTQGRTETRREQALYAIVCLFLAALVLRAATTSAAPVPPIC